VNYMGYRVKTLDEVRDSRLLYEKKVPAFGYILILVVMAFMVLLGIWAYKTPKESVIKATGVVQSKEKNYVMSPYTGQILSVNYEEGKVVSEGDVLFTIKSTELDLQAKQLEEQKTLLNKNIVNYEKYIKSLEADNNLFNEREINESSFYNKFQAYKNQVEQITVNEDMLKAYGYSDEDIKKELEKKDKKIEQLYYTEVNGANDTIAQYKDQLATIDIQLGALNTGKEEYEVKTMKSGTVHVLEQYNQGMIIQTGAKVCSIASNTEDLEIVATVSETDAVKVKKGDSVELAIAGLTQSVYGTITGEVVEKDCDVSVNATANGNVAYFKLVIKPDYNYVVGKDGDKVNLSSGMSVESRIKYDEITYMYYALEALGIKL